jgi:general stress protein 26
VDVATFDDIADEFQKRIQRIVWCTFGTVDSTGRPRSRILHPIWEGATGWIATGRSSLKAKHIAANPYVTLCYWDLQHEQVIADCRADWEDSVEEKRRLWDLYLHTPPPMGYDLAKLWPAGPEDPTLGFLRLTPWRIELSGISAAAQPWQVWRAAGVP